MNKYIIVDWANNHLFRKHEFDSFDDGWTFLYEKFPDEEDLGDYYVIPKNEYKPN